LKRSGKSILLTAMVGDDEMSGQVYPRLRSPELDPGRPKGPELGPRQGAQGQIQALLRRAQGLLKTLLRLSAGLHSHSSRSLTHGSGFNTGCSGLKTEMDFGEVKIRV
jgi:hypothetical protein